VLYKELVALSAVYKGNWGFRKVLHVSGLLLAGRSQISSDSSIFNKATAIAGSMRHPDIIFLIRILTFYYTTVNAPRVVVFICLLVIRCIASSWILYKKQGPPYQMTTAIVNRSILQALALFTLPGNVLIRLFFKHPNKNERS